MLACTLQLFIAYKELSFTDLIRFLQPLSDINRTGSVLRKGRVYCKEHKTCSDWTSVHVTLRPLKCVSSAKSLGPSEPRFALKGRIFPSSKS